MFCNVSDSYFAITITYVLIFFQIFFIYGLIYISFFGSIIEFQIRFVNL